MKQQKITEQQKAVTKLFKKYIVKRPNGNCQVLFALTELDDLVDEIIASLTSEVVRKERELQLKNILYFLQKLQGMASRIGKTKKGEIDPTVNLGAELHIGIHTIQVQLTQLSALSKERATE